MKQRCLLIADDLTGGADAGAQFAKGGFTTFLISMLGDAKIDLSRHARHDVLVVNTDSRGLTPEHAFLKVSSLFTHFDAQLFPIIYKKIDSTLRGNIGYEIDAILKATDSFLCFLAPTYPEQKRTVVGGILIVGEKPLAQTEVARNTFSPMEESHVYKILQGQSRNNVGCIDLTHVASTPEKLLKTVNEKREKGNKIIIFDAVSREDLRNIVEVGFSLERIPLFVGSAGLAEEVAKRFPSSNTKVSRKLKPYKHILLVSGTASSITHQQLRRIEKKGSVRAFQLTKTLIVGGNGKPREEREAIVKGITNAISRGIAILKSPPEILVPDEDGEIPAHLKITETLASITVASLEGSPIKSRDLALLLTGGETAQRVLNVLQPQGIEIEGELLEGIVVGHLVGGNWDGLTVVTKAGGFGKEDAMERTVKMLESGCSWTEEGS